MYHDSEKEHTFHRMYNVFKSYIISSLLLSVALFLIIEGHFPNITMRSICTLIYFTILLVFLIRVYTIYDVNESIEKETTNEEKSIFNDNRKNIRSYTFSLIETSLITILILATMIVSNLTFNEMPFDFTYNESSNNDFFDVDFDDYTTKILNFDIIWSLLELVTYICFFLVGGEIILSISHNKDVVVDSHKYHPPTKNPKVEEVIVFSKKMSVKIQELISKLQKKYRKKSQ